MLEKLLSVLQLSDAARQNPLTNSDLNYNVHCNASEVAMPNKASTLNVRAIGDSSGVILPKATLEHLGVSRGQRLIATPVPGAVVLIPDEGRMGAIVADALSFMDENDDAFRELSMR
jgi:antitoxin component of MazEF toxin-antitoxin module